MSFFGYIFNRKDILLYFFYRSKNRKKAKAEDAAGEDLGAQQRKIKEQFKTNIAGVIVQHLNPYRKETCTIGRITNNEDFKHLARKVCLRK